MHARFLFLLIAAGFATTLSSCRRSPAGKDGAPTFKTEYRMQVNVGPTTYWGMGAAKFAELVKEKTHGRIRVKPYYGSQLLKGAQLNAAQTVAMGGIDCAFESTINTAPAIPEMNVFCLPFFIPSYAAIDRVEKGQCGRLLFNAMEKKGLMPLAWGENGFRQLTNSRHAVQRPEDLKNLKIRVVGSPLFIDIFRTLGADPVNMNWGDAITAFQQGTVDGQENPVQILLAVQIHQYHKFMTRWNYLADPLILYWNRKEFLAFPADIQQAIRAAAGDAAQYQKALARTGLDNGASLALLKDKFKFTPKIVDPLAHFKQHGITITQLGAAERQAFKQATAAIREKWTERIGRAVVEAAKLDMKMSKEKNGYVP